MVGFDVILTIYTNIFVAEVICSIKDVKMVEVV
jgi:hypothetical protein